MVIIGFQTNNTHNGSSSHGLFHFIQFFDISMWIEDDANIGRNCETCEEGDWFPFILSIPSKVIRLIQNVYV